ncbi:MAG TPA: MarR family winged helix-turn-helix transcriptional regulator, partial [Marmoricola sp.]|nr:MarR family winged helix-turn-helix transcriptional regulator [Marmoricola sp.]
AARDHGMERLFTGMVTLARRMHTTGQRWTEVASDLTTAEAAMMRVVAREGTCRPGSVAAQLGVGPSAVSRQLTGLCERGLVERHPDPADGRAELLGLTDTGRKTMAERRAAYLERLRCRFADWDQSRLDAAADLLEELATLLASEPPDARPDDPTSTHDSKEHR